MERKESNSLLFRCHFHFLHRGPDGPRLRVTPVNLTLVSQFRIESPSCETARRGNPGGIIKFPLDKGKAKLSSADASEQRAHGGYYSPHISLTVA